MISNGLKQWLRQMQQSSQTEQIAIADCLLDIAENGDDDDNDDFLLAVAEELRDSAQAVINYIQGRQAQG